MGQKLAWKDIRREYPASFVLLNHCEETPIGKRRIRVTRGEVVFACADGKMIYDEYCKHGQPPHMTFGHTDSETLELEEIPFLGIRPLNE